MIYKNFPTNVKAMDTEAGIYSAMISTEEIDREGDQVVATGVQIGRFLLNPIVLFGHQYDQPPVAKALSVEILPGRGVKSTFQFPNRGISHRADEVRGLWEAGFLRAMSIGFIPLTWEALTEREWGPRKYTSVELLEHSIVDVPANASSLALSMKTMQDGLKRAQKLSPTEMDQEIFRYLDQLVTVLSLQMGAHKLQQKLKPKAKTPLAPRPEWLSDSALWAKRSEAEVEREISRSFGELSILSLRARLELSKQAILR